MLQYVHCSVHICLVYSDGCYVEWNYCLITERTCARPMYSNGLQHAAAEGLMCLIAKVRFSAQLLYPSISGQANTWISAGFALLASNCSVGTTATTAHANTDTQAILHRTSSTIKQGSQLIILD